MLKTASGFNTIKALQAKFKSINPVKCFKARREIPKFNLQPELESDHSDTEEIFPSLHSDTRSKKKTTETDTRAETEIEPVEDMLIQLELKHAFKSVTLTQ